MALVAPTRRTVPDFQTPQKVQIVNLDADRTLEAQFNPTDLEEQIGASYTKLTVPGLSHQVVQYTNTENATYSFELFMDATPLGVQGLDLILEARKFLYAACHPKATPGRLVGEGTPRLLLIWPGILSIKCVLTKLQFRHTRFNKLLEPTAYTANVTLEEIRSSLVTMEDILAHGTKGSNPVVDLDALDPTGD